MELVYFFTDCGLKKNLWAHELISQEATKGVKLRNRILSGHREAECEGFREVFVDGAAAGRAG